MTDPSKQEALKEVTPADIVGALKATTKDLTARIGSFEKVWGPPGSRIACRFHYLKFRDSKPTVDDLIRLAHTRIINFVIPRWRIKEVVAQLARWKSSDGEASMTLTNASHCELTS